jgi:hypothetical protein
MRAAREYVDRRGTAGIASAAVTLTLLLLVAAAPMAVAQQGGGGVNQPNVVPNELLVKFAAGVSPAQAQESIQRAGAQVVGAPVLDGRLFHVRTSDPSSLAAAKSALEQAAGVEYVEPVHTVTTQSPAAR